MSGSAGAERMANTEQAMDYGSRLLQSNRIRLVAAEDAHFAELARWWQLPEWAVLQQGVIQPRPAETIASQFRQWSDNSSQAAAGFAVVADGVLVGHVTLWGITTVERIGTFAIIIGPEHVGKGYGTEATRLMVDYGFRELGLNKIELQVWSFNDRAQRTYERCGFVVEGVRRAAVFHDGRFHDQTLMGILADEYFAGAGHAE